MKQFSLYVMSFFLLGLVSCRKDMPLPDTGEPVFHLDAQLDGVMESIVAGDEGYYMYTSYLTDGLVPRMKGELKSSTSGLSSWNFEFVGNSSNGSIDIDSVLTVGSKGLYSSEDVIDEGVLNIAPHADFGNGTSGITDYYWRFMLGEAVVDTAPIFKFNTIENSTKKPIVTIGTRMSNGYTIESNRCLDPAYPEAWASFELEMTAYGAYLFYLTPSFSNDIEEVCWAINGYCVGVSDTLVYLHPPTAIGSRFFASASFRHNSGARTCSAREIVVLGPSVIPPDIDFTHEVKSAEEYNPLRLNKLKIDYTSPSGTVYSTSLHKSPGNVRIEEVTNYENDKSGRPTKQIILKGDFLLQDASGNVLHVNNADIVIAVATSDP